MYSETELHCDCTHRKVNEKVPSLQPDLVQINKCTVWQLLNTVVSQVKEPQVIQTF